MSLPSSSPRPSLRGQFIDADIDLSSLGSALWRKRYAILRPTIVVALFAFAVVNVIPPKYQSEARVLVVGRDNVFLRPDADKDVIDRGIVDQEAVVSQAQLILSRDLATEVIAMLKLNELPEFDQAIGGVSLLKTLLAVFGITKNPMAMTPEERVLEAYYDRLSVFPVEKSHVIVIDFLSENPELAARVANAIADGYLKRQQEAKQDQARSASTWLSGEIETMRKKVADADAKVEAFRAKSNLLVGPNNTTLSVQQLGDLNGQLAAARAQKSDADAKARLIRDMLKSGEPIEFVRHPQFRIDPPALRAAGDLTRATCRAVVVAARQSSAHQGAAGADRRPRHPDQERGGNPCALTGKRRQARRRQGRGSAFDLRPAQEPGGDLERG